MTLFDQITLLITGLIAIYLIYTFYKRYTTKGGINNVYYMISFTVLLVSGLLLIILSYSILSNPLVVVVAALIPISLSLGLISEYANKYEKYYLIFAIIGLVLISITQVIGPELLRTISLASIHSIAAAVILLMPIYVSRKDVNSRSFIFVSVGGLLISVGGISLAFLKLGSPILSSDIIFTILAPVLFFMSLSYAYGFSKTIKSEHTSIDA